MSHPSAKTKDLLNCLIEDLTKGCSEGFWCRDAFSYKRRIFIDVVGVTRDTLGINETLNVQGHTGNVCSQLCTFNVTKRGDELRYCGTTKHSGKTEYRRNYGNMETILHCSENESILKDCGLTSDKSHPNTLFLMKLRKSFAAVQKNMQTVTNFQLIVPLKIDPYICSFIGIDHLLTGLIKDAAITDCYSLHECSCTILFEDIFAKFTDRFRLPIRPALFNQNCTSISRMNMTEIFQVLPSMLSAMAYTLTSQNINPILCITPLIALSIIAFLTGILNNKTRSTDNYLLSHEDIKICQKLARMYCDT